MYNLYTNNLKQNPLIHKKMKQKITWLFILCVICLTGCASNRNSGLDPQFVRLNTEALLLKEKKNDSLMYIVNKNQEMFEKLYAFIKQRGHPIRKGYYKYPFRDSHGGRHELIVNSRTKEHFISVYGYRNGRIAHNNETLVVYTIDTSYVLRYPHGSDMEISKSIEEKAFMQRGYEEFGTIVRNVESY